MNDAWLFDTAEGHICLNDDLQIGFRLRAF
jgi:hypothetical protein